jgi:nucleotide-binding universal stress UspA family protein
LATDTDREATKEELMRPILLATDGSPSADAATREAFELAAALEAPLIIASVAHPVVPPYGGYYGYGEIAADLHRTEAQHVTSVLTAARERALAAGIECETVALDGPAGEEICRTAQAHDARLIVVGAHGWGTVGRILHGSVSTYVLHHAASPVLVVQGTTDGEAAEPRSHAATAALA